MFNGAGPKKMKDYKTTVFKMKHNVSAFVIFHFIKNIKSNQSENKTQILKINQNQHVNMQIHGALKFNSNSYAHQHIIREHCIHTVHKYVVFLVHHGILLHRPAYLGMLAPLWSSALHCQRTQALPENSHSVFFQCMYKI